MFGGGPKYQKLTTNLRLSINRLKLLEKKKTEMAVKARKEIADYLAGGKEERARIRVEHIVREDYIVEGMELIEMYCDLLLARMGLIQSAKEMDPGLEEPIASIIWATPRLQADCPELKVVSEQLALKYSKEFAQSCRNNELGNVSEKIMHKLGVQAPPRALIDKYLEEIAKTYNVPFTPRADPTHDEVLRAEGMLIDFTDKNRGVSQGGASGGQAQPPPAGFAYPQPHGGHAPPFTMPPGAAQYTNPPPPNSQAMYPPSQQNEKPPLNGPVVQAPTAPPPSFPDLPDLPSVPGDSKPVGGASNNSEDVNFDDLTRRFEELKKKK